jgi:hypothetical protein
MSREQGPHSRGMRAAAIAAGRRQCGREIATPEKEAAA